MASSPIQSISRPSGGGDPGIGRSNLPALLATLSRPSAYPHRVDTVEVIETPLSWVVLAGEFAYKIKRPVRYPFVDLRDSERRKFLCEEELRLNRRFAPELYLEVCRIVAVNGEARIGTEGAILEYAVRMRRFPRSDELDRLLEGMRVEPLELEAFGRALAIMHAKLPAASTDSPWGCPAELQGILVRNLLECAEASALFGASGDVFALRGTLERRLPAAASVMAARRLNGRIRECHGDLHCRNIVRLGSRLVPFDCLEYEPAFRWIDVADEVAFLSSDLASRARPLHAHAFIGGYLAQGGDYHACRVLRLYEAHRALVRAKVTALAAGERPEGSAREALRAEHGRLLEHAMVALMAHRPLLVLIAGLSGSGKTWLARLLASRLAAIHLRSDVERKRLAGLDALTRSRSGVAEGLYSSETNALVYEHLARSAEDVISGGYTAIVDATFLRRDERARFAALGSQLRVATHLLYCHAPVSVLRSRIAERSRSGLDPSEADECVLDWQMSQLEALGAQEPFDVIRIETADADALEKTLHHLGAADVDE